MSQLIQSDTATNDGNYYNQFFKFEKAACFLNKWTFEVDAETEYSRSEDLQTGEVTWFDMEEQWELSEELSQIMERLYSCWLVRKNEQESKVIPMFEVQQ